MPKLVNWLFLKNGYADLIYRLAISYTQQEVLGLDISSMHQISLLHILCVLALCMTYSVCVLLVHSFVCSLV